MLHRVVTSSQPMLYVTTSCSTRPSAMAAEVKVSLATVRDFMALQAVTPLGPPIVSYGDRDGRRVTIEAGYPVGAADGVLASGRVLAGHTPGGPAVTCVYRGSSAALEAERVRIEAEVATEGAFVTSLSWERYLDGDGTGPGNITQLYVQVIEPPDVPSVENQTAV